MNKGHWHTACTLDPDTYIGFVYTIRNTITGRRYIGQKRYWSAVTRPPLKGRKNKRRSKKESNWTTYTGSSRQLNEDIAEHGLDKFTFFIEEQCTCLWELNYREAKRILDADAIPRRDYYNEYLGRLGSCPNALQTG